MVSVIIPNYNHATYLQQRIESVLDQTYRDFELIILDDASTDRSEKIIEQYRGNPKVSSIVYNKINSRSTFKQWEKGIALAAGQYIWIAESDDYCGQTFLQEALIHMNHQNSDIHYCQSSLVDENNQIIEHTLKWPEAVTGINWKNHLVMNGKEFIRTALQYRNVIPNASAVVFRKKDFDFSGLSKYRSGGDWLFWIRILLNATITYSPEILNSFRSHSNTTRAGTEHHKILLRYFEELAVRYDLNTKYMLGDKAEMQRFLNATIGVCRISDMRFFMKFCRDFHLPAGFLIQFIIRKLCYTK